MAENPRDPIADDAHTLRRLGYAQELLRRMSGFSNYALSLSIICILAGGITSFYQGYGSVGGASIGLGWPLACLLALAVAATMAQVASAFPTAGGLYHWASILGGKGWGWATAWFNLLGLVLILSVVNVGLYDFALGSLLPYIGCNPGSVASKLIVVGLVTGSQGLMNHLGIRVATWLTDFSGYWIVATSVALTVALLAYAAHPDPGRLLEFKNYSGLPADNPTWPRTDSMLWLFAVGLILPAYTVTGFDASAHVAEETISAAHHVPRAMLRSVLVSGVFGWVMLAALVLAIPDVDAAARQGEGIIPAIFLGGPEPGPPNDPEHAVRAEAGAPAAAPVLPRGVALPLYAAIALAQYLCGLATVTSASRMTYAFARDGGLPGSRLLRWVSPVYLTPPFAIWAVVAVAVLFTVYAPFYATLTAACTTFLYVSYLIPTALGFFAHGRRWKQMGPWHLGPFYRPLAVLCVLYCGLLIVVGMAPPHEKAFGITAALAGLLGVTWFGFQRHHFQGPPRGLGIEFPFKDQEHEHAP